MDTCNLDELKKVEPEEYCWKTGHYLTSCDCDMCDHKYDCSGYEGEDDDE